MKKRLTELLNQIRGDEIALMNEEAKIIVDHFIDNGVVAPLVDVGDKIKVFTKALPTYDIDEVTEDLPEYLDGEVVSIRKNIKGWFFKIKVYARWVKYDESYMCDRYFTYPMSAIGKTVHPTEKGGEG